MLACCVVEHAVNASADRAKANVFRIVTLLELSRSISAAVGGL